MLRQTRCHVCSFSNSPAGALIRCCCSAWCPELAAIHCLGTGLGCNHPGRWQPLVTDDHVRFRNWAAG